MMLEVSTLDSFLAEVGDGKVRLKDQMGQYQDEKGKVFNEYSILLSCRIVKEASPYIVVYGEAVGTAEASDAAKTTEIETKRKEQVARIIQKVKDNGSNMGYGIWRE
jgi:hypothetical protein